MAGEAISPLAGVGIALILAGLLVFYAPTMTSGGRVAIACGWPQEVRRFKQ